MIYGSLTKVDMICVQSFGEFRVLVPQHGADLWNVPQGWRRSNLGTRNLFCYFFLRLDNFLTRQKTKTLKMVGTGIQIWKLSKCPFYFVLGESVVHSVLSKNLCTRTGAISPFRGSSLNKHERFLVQKYIVATLPSRRCPSSTMSSGVQITHGLQTGRVR